MKVFYSDKYISSATAFETTRKAGWVASSFDGRPMTGVEIVAPLPLTEAQVLGTHGKEYVDGVKTGKGNIRSPFAWDPQLWTMVTASNGGVVAAALTAMQEGVSGSLSSGLHHAKKDYGEGFCTFNGLVIAAKEALDHGANNVLILDLDAHCGGGTASLILHDERIWQADVSTVSYDLYDEQQNARLVISREAYLADIESMLRTVDAEFPAFDLCIYNAGVDPHDSRRINDHVLALRDELVFNWAAAKRLPIAFVLAGGYLTGITKEQLVDLHRQTVAAALAVSPLYR